MTSRKSLAALMLAVCFMLAAPAPGWGGGQDVVFGVHGGGNGNGNKMTENPRFRSTGSIDHPRGSPKAIDQSWLTRLWNFLAMMYGINFRNLDPTSTP